VSEAEKEARKELRLKGIGVSSGIALGKAVLVAPRSRAALVPRRIAEEEVPLEIARFEEALIATREQIVKIRDNVAEALGEDHAAIFDAHLLVADDRTLVEEVVREIRKRKLCAEVVLQHVANRYADMLAKVEDAYLAERAADLRDVARRIVANLSGEAQNPLDRIAEPCIVVAHDVSPSETAAIDRRFVLGFVTDLGSPTSHMAIMAKALTIPAVVGLHDASETVEPGDTILIDGTRGEVFVNPTPQRRAEYEARAREQREILDRLETLRDKPPTTKDGRLVPITANVELLEELDTLADRGVRGIGLFRTEFLFLGANVFPDEAEQTAAYDRAAAAQYPAPVVIRTLDLGADKMPAHLELPPETNPFLGIRAIRLCLAHPNLFKTQLRAILRASARGNVRIMYPMISCVRELEQANATLRECMEELRAENVPFDENVEIGTMIEVPSAALVADLLAPRVNFFSIGTNDLIQYTMAADRGNEGVAHLCKPTHLAIVRLIDLVVRAARERGVRVCVCGQMASVPLLVPLLVGLGVDELSVSPSQALLVKDVVRNINFSDAEELAREALNASSAEEVERICHRMIEERAPEILELSE